MAGKVVGVIAAFAGVWAMVIGSPAVAGGVELWRGFVHGSGAEAVVGHLLTLPEVASAKASKPNKEGVSKVSLKYRADGFDLFDHKFVAAFDVKSDGLSAVSLTTSDLCVDDGAKLMTSLATVLSEKYPNHLTGPIEFKEQDGRLLALRAAIRDHAQSTSSAFDNGSTSVIIIQVFAHEEYPTSYDRSKLGQFIYSMSKAAYESRKAECGGTGDDRAGVVIKYLPKSEVDAQIATLQADRNADLATARAGL